MHLRRSVLASVFLGVAVTVASAWYFAIFAVLPHYPPIRTGTSWAVPIADTWAESPAAELRVVRPGATFTLQIGYAVRGAAPADPLTETEGQQLVYSVGWPFYALRSEVIWGPPGPQVVSSGWRSGIPTGVPFDSYGFNDYRRCLPLIPEWPGFLVDSALFGAVALITLFLLTGVRRLRAGVRRRHRLCERCAYPLGSSQSCTECGTVHPRLANERCS